MIFKFLLLFILFIGVLVFVMGFSFLRLLRDMFLGRSNQSRAQQRQYTQSQQGRAQQRSQQRQQDYQQPTPSKKDKIFAKDEGEYVDFEEVND